MAIRPAQPPPSAADALRWCERYARRHQENFTVVSRLLPRRHRAPMFAVYAFCRYTDDLGDEAEGDRIALLEEWRAETERAFAGEGSHPISVALHRAARDRPLSPRPFLDLIEANLLDQRKHRYETFDELLGYCRLSANTVGRMVLAVWGYDDEYRGALADHTCTGLQLANHWQDVARDWKAGRLYLPLEDLRDFGVSEDDIGAGRCTDAFREMMQFEVDRAEACFRIGRRLADELPRELAVDVQLFTDGGLAVLRAIEAQDYDVLSRRPRAGRARRALLAARAAAAAALR